MTMQQPVTADVARSDRTDTATMNLSQPHHSDLFVESWGAGTPVVLVHGSLATGVEEWEAQRPLADEGFRLLVLDRRGYGQSPVADGEDFLRRRRRHRRADGRRCPSRRSFLRRPRRHVRRGPPARSDAVADAARACRVRLGGGPPEGAFTRRRRSSASGTWTFPTRSGSSAS